LRSTLFSFIAKGFIPTVIILLLIGNIIALLGLSFENRLLRHRLENTFGEKICWNGITTIVSENLKVQNVIKTRTWKFSQDMCFTDVEMGKMRDLEASKRYLLEQRYEGK
jgi:hypothetical protein